MGTEGARALLGRAAGLTLQTGNLLNWGCLRKKCPATPGEEETLDVLECTVAQAIEKINPEERDELKVSACSALGVAQLDSVIIAPPPLEDGTTLSLEYLQPYWQELESLVQNKKIVAIGTSDLDKTLLEQLYLWAQVKPSSNQVNLASCCVMPPDLTAFAKEFDIQLLTHNDPKAAFTLPALWKSGSVEYVAPLKMFDCKKRPLFVGSAERSTPVTRSMTRRRTKSIHKPEVIQESQFEELEHAETKSDVSDSSEMQITRNENTTVPPAQSVAEPPIDGDVSETESNCSSVSGFQTPLFVRVTRRRQIVIPYQPDTADKKRRDNTSFVNKLSRILDEEISEAESCSSAVSGVQMSVTRTTRSRQSKKKLQPDTVCEAQSGDTSDAESCCLSSPMEPSSTTKRITRSMQMKSQGENTKESEKKIISKDEDLTEDTVKSEPIIISDSRPGELVSDTEDASVVIKGNKEPISPKSKCSSKSATTTQSENTEEVLNDVTPKSLTKVKQSDTKSPVKKTRKNTESIEIDLSEAACGQIQEDHNKVLEREGKLEHMDISLTECMSPKQLLESQGQVTPDENKKIPECKRVNAEANAQQSFTHADKLGKTKRASAVSSLPKDVAVAQRTDSIDKGRVLEIDADSGEDQIKEYEVSHSCERSSTGNDSVALFLSNSESEESENSDVEDIDTVDENLCYKKSDGGTPSLSESLKNSSLHVEGLFAIDTEPGMSSSQKYYLDEVDQDSDAESKHEGSEKAEESDLEDTEEELIDENDKDEDDDLLNNNIDVLHLSSSIDPGLNIKKLGGLYISFDTKKQKPKPSVIEQLKGKKKAQLLQKSVITPDFEKKECVPPLRESLHQLKKQRRAEREKTAGDGWFGMKAPEITSELKNDLKVLKMRASLDPKHFYKKNDRDGLPKYFQVGTVVDSPIDFYHSRIPKKQRKRTIVEELLADSEFRRYNKKKYQEIMSEKAAFAAGKRNRKKKKFHN
ncbi:deoxynucleotidyltransferase terminal interacting protein 2 [Willisornis vidua]|uniref:Deoxynucleotidyltransferase terminal interacting protein 2 n=1 Tax=Willisornis vidua TaxID=1566151 RepID=A0ABQ9CWA2_9PASS|nr:deoxynucleotidyltransferase terminal interacting protein 2 [Willisornis vidua]